MKQLLYSYPGGLQPTDTVTGTVGGNTSEIPISAILALASGSSASVPGTKGPRLALYTDSLVDVGFAQIAAQTSAGGFVVDVNGIATFRAPNSGAKTGAIPGNYVKVYNPSDPTLHDYNNNRMVNVISAADFWTFTFDTRDLSGVPMAADDYSNTYGGPWYVQPLTVQADMGWLNQLNYLMGGVFQVVANYGFSGQTGAAAAEYFNRSFDGPAMDAAIVCLGTADVVFNTTVANAILAAIEEAYPVLEVMLQTFESRGTPVFLCLPIGVDSPATNVQIANIGLLSLRDALIQLKSLRAPATKLIDLAGTLFDGTKVNGGLIANATVDGYHPTSWAALNIAKDQVASWREWFTRALDFQPISILQDAPDQPQPGSLYANLVKNGLMVGTATSALVAGSTGSLPTGWASGGLGGGGALTGTLATAGQVVRIAQPNKPANSTLWGYGLNVDCTWSASGQGFVLASPDFSGYMFGGNWYRFGLTVFARADAVNLMPLQVIFQLLNGVNLPPLTLNASSPGTTTWPLKSGDCPEMVSWPFFYPLGQTALTNAFMQILGISAGAGSCSLQLANAWVRKEDSPYA